MKRWLIRMKCSNQGVYQVPVIRRGRYHKNEELTEHTGCMYLCSSSSSGKLRQKESSKPLHPEDTRPR
ncbi:unnamed protein product, partial [Pylaiella littoralis]